MFPRDGEPLSGMSQHDIDEKLTELTQLLVGLVGEETEKSVIETSEATIEIKDKKRKETVRLTTLPIRSINFLGRGEFIEELERKLQNQTRSCLSMAWAA